MKKIQLRIYADGKIEAETLGIKGKSCLDYMKIIEKIADAQIVDSDFTGEYYENEASNNVKEVTEVTG